MQLGRSVVVRVSQFVFVGLSWRVHIQWTSLGPVALQRQQRLVSFLPTCSHSA